MSLNWLNEGDFNPILITANNAQHSSWRLLLFFFKLNRVRIFDRQKSYDLFLTSRQKLVGLRYGRYFTLGLVNY
jgi:hypothetical protein